MRRTQIRQFLSGIHPGLEITRHSNRGQHVGHGGNDAVYCYTRFIGAIPPRDMAIVSLGKDRSLRGLVKKLRQKGILTPHNYRKAHAALSKRLIGTKKVTSGS